MFAQAPSAPRLNREISPAQRDQWKQWFLAASDDNSRTTALDDTKARMQALLAQRRGSLVGGASPW